MNALIPAAAAAHFIDSELLLSNVLPFVKSLSYGKTMLTLSALPDSERETVDLQIEAAHRRASGEASKGEQKAAEVLGCFAFIAEEIEDDRPAEFMERDWELSPESREELAQAWRTIKSLTAHLASDTSKMEGGEEN